MNQQEVDPIIRTEEDYRWWYHQGDNRVRYAGQIIILWNRELIGSGQDAGEAWKEADRFLAERQQPQPDWLVCVPVPPLVHCDPVTGLIIPWEEVRKDG
jgi:hypothetical protein